MFVVKRDGKQKELDISQVRKQTIPACEGLKNVSYEELELNAKIMFYDGIHTEEIQKSLIKSANDLVSIEASDYTYVAARLALYDLYHNIKRIYNRKGSGDVYQKVNLEDYIDYNKELFSEWYTKYNKEEINHLNTIIDPKRDLLYNYAGLTTLMSRYLVKKNKQISELPQHMHMALAMFIMQNEEKSKRIDYVIELYNALSKLEYINPTPINSNGRLNEGGLISCLLTTVHDSIEGIMDKFKEIAVGSKNGSGWGVDFSRLRSVGSAIGNKPNASSGKIPFLKVANDLLVAVDQGGKRPGAGAFYISIWDIDVFNFLDLKKKHGDQRLRAMDIFPALSVDDVFMKRMINGENYTLFDPRDVPELLETYGDEFEQYYLKYENEFKENPSKFNPKTETIESKKLALYIINSYYENGTPFLFFKDNVNKQHRHPQLGIIRSANLCLAGNSMVALPNPNDPNDYNYYKPIWELAKESNGREKFPVYSAHFENGQWIREVKDAVAFRIGKKKTVTLVFDNSDTLECTPDHKLALYEGGYIKAEDAMGKMIAAFGKEDHPFMVVFGIHENEETDVYDLTVDDNHNFYVNTHHVVDDLLCAQGVLVHNCVVGETKILTKEYGNQPIKELVDSGNTDLMCWNGLEWSQTKLFKANESAKIMKVTLNNGTVIECDKEHDWWLKTDQGDIKVKTYNLKPNDQIIDFNYPEEYHDLKIANLKIFKVEETDRYAPTYCGTEPKRHMLMFNGVLTGQCTEVILPTTDELTGVCNLGSINLAKCNANEDLDRVTRIAIRAIDNAIDLTPYPSKESENFQLKYRACGLGMLGEAEYIAINKIHYGSDKHKEEVERIYSTIAEAAHRTSQELGKEKGDCEISGYRNAYLMAIAPNSSSGLLASTTNSHEPVYARIWVENNKFGAIKMTAPNITVENQQYYKTPFEIPLKDQIAVNAIRQKYIDMSISFNLYFLPEDISTSKVRDAIVDAWRSGLKCTYYLRTKPISNNDLDQPLLKSKNGIVCEGCEN